MTNLQKGLAELIGTFWLMFGGSSSVALAAAYRALGADAHAKPDIVGD